MSCSSRASNGRARQTGDAADLQPATKDTTVNTLAPQDENRSPSTAAVSRIGRVDLTDRSKPSVKMGRSTGNGISATILLCLTAGPFVLGCAAADDPTDNDAAFGEVHSALLGVNGTVFNEGDSVPVCFVVAPRVHVNPENDEVEIGFQRQKPDTDAYGAKRAGVSDPHRIASWMDTITCLELNDDLPVVAACNPASGSWRWIRMNGNEGALMRVSNTSTRCLTVHGNGTDDGTKVELSACDPNGTDPLPAGQLWKRMSDGTLMNGTKCLDVPASKLGSQVAIYDCNGGDNQKWTTKDPSAGRGPITSGLTKGYCLDLLDGTPVATPCNDDTDEWRWIQWNNADRGALMVNAGNDDRGKCLEVENDTNDDGTKVGLGDCDRGAPVLKERQTWIRLSEGKLQRPNSTKCLDIPHGDMATQLEIHECSNGANQVWNTRNPEDGTEFNREYLRQRVRDAIENGYNRWANLNLTGWDDCPKGDDGMHHTDQLEGWIAINFGHRSAAGHHHVSRTDPRRLASSNGYDWPSLIGDDFPDLLGNDYVDTILHEFGHSLGFDHGFFRSDWPYRVCAASMFGENRQFNSAVEIAGEPACISSKDSNFNGTLTLHKCWDTSALRTGLKWTKWREGYDGYDGGDTYGGAIQAYKVFPDSQKKANEPTNKCLTIPGNVADNGTKVRLSECKGDVGQLWVPDTYGSLKNPNSRKCLAVPGITPNPNGELIIWDCDGGVNQRWNSMEGDTWGTQPDPNSLMQYCVEGTATIKSGVSDQDNCLQVGPDSTAIIGDCSSVYDFGWRWEEWDKKTHTGTKNAKGKVSGALRMYMGDSPTHQCLDVRNSVGPEVQLWDCNRTRAQLWEPGEDKTLMNSGQCLEVSSTGQLRMVNCSMTAPPPANQRWDIEEINQDHQPVPLSGWDMVGLHNAYGRKPPGSVVGLYGRCVTIPSSAPGMGQTLTANPCDGAPNQQWFQDSQAHLLTPSYFDSYWDVAGGELLPGTAVQTWRRNYPVTPNQQWRFNEVAVMAIGDTCVGVPSNDFHDTAPTEIQACTQQTSQKWAVIPTGMVAGESVVEIAHGNFCWDVPNGVSESGRAIQVYGCHGGSNQRFTLTSQGQIKFTANGVELCVDVSDGTPELGKDLQLYPCKSDSDLNRENQLFYLRGPIEVGDSSDMCLEVPYPATPADRDGTALQIGRCDGGSDQEWDYYFPPQVDCYNCDDGNPCTEESCAEACQSSAVADGTQCPDDDDPDTDDYCVAGTCMHPSHDSTTLTPCTGICEDPVDFAWSGSYQSGPLGPDSVCRQTTQNWVGGNCGNFAGDRALYINGTQMSCNYQNWVPPEPVNGGYCVFATAGNHPWATFTAW